MHPLHRTCLLDSENVIGRSTRDDLRSIIADLQREEEQDHGEQRCLASLLLATLSSVLNLTGVDFFGDCNFLLNVLSNFEHLGEKKTLNSTRA